MDQEPLRTASVTTTTAATDNIVTTTTAATDNIASAVVIIKCLHAGFIVINILHLNTAVVSYGCDNSQWRVAMFSSKTKCSEVSSHRELKWSEESNQSEQQDCLTTVILGGLMHQTTSIHGGLEHQATMNLKGGLTHQATTI